MASGQDYVQCHKCGFRGLPNQNGVHDCDPARLHALQYVKERPPAIAPEDIAAVVADFETVGGDIRAVIGAIHNDPRTGSYVAGEDLEPGAIAMVDVGGRRVVRLGFDADRITAVNHVATEYSRLITAVNHVATEYSRLLGRHIRITRDDDWKLTIAQKCSACHEDIAKTIPWPGSVAALHGKVATAIRTTYLLHTCKSVEQSSLNGLTYDELAALREALDLDFCRIGDRINDIAKLEAARVITGPNEETTP